jgi:hypothetical protein
VKHLGGKVDMLTLKNRVRRIKEPKENVPDLFEED